VSLVEAWIALALLALTVTLVALGVWKALDRHVAHQPATDAGT
jgi:hypothetical protein